MEARWCDPYEENCDICRPIDLPLPGSSTSQTDVISSSQSEPTVPRQLSVTSCQQPQSPPAQQQPIRTPHQATRPSDDPHEADRMPQPVTDLPDPQNQPAQTPQRHAPQPYPRRQASLTPQNQIASPIQPARAAPSPIIPSSAKRACPPLFDQTPSKHPRRQAIVPESSTSYQGELWSSFVPETEPSSPPPVQQSAGQTTVLLPAFSPSLRVSPLESRIGFRPASNIIISPQLVDEVPPLEQIRKTLDDLAEHCLLCFLEGRGRVGHYWRRCPDSDFVAQVALASPLDRAQRPSHLVRFKKITGQYTGCFRCLLPQHICQTWQPKDNRIGRDASYDFSPNKPSGVASKFWCVHQDLIWDILFTMTKVQGHPLYDRWRPVLDQTFENWRRSPASQDRPQDRAHWLGSQWLMGMDSWQCNTAFRVAWSCIVSI